MKKAYVYVPYARSIFCLNVIAVLKCATRGGKLIIKRAFLETRRIAVFNGDRYFHEVTRIEEGVRTSLLLTITLGSFSEVQESFTR